MNLKRFIDFVTIALMLTFCILYPGWVINGYLDTWYLKIAVGIAAYGGFPVRYPHFRLSCQG